MPKVQVHLGNQAYLFKEPNGYAPKCLISSHGVFRMDSQTYTPPLGVTLHFYCPHDQTVDDVLTVNDWMFEHPGVVESLPNRDLGIVSCRDYVLKKLQEGHRQIHAEAKKLNISYTQADDRYPAGETYGRLRRLHLPQYDIATVRRRHPFFGGDELRLSEMITLIEAEHHYSDYHCLFCRESQ